MTGLDHLEPASVAPASTSTSFAVDTSPVIQPLNLHSSTRRVDHKTPGDGDHATWLLRRVGSASLPLEEIRGRSRVRLRHLDLRTVNLNLAIYHNNKQPTQTCPNIDQIPLLPPLAGTATPR